MKTFQRTTRQSRILGFTGLALALTLALVFMLIGFVGHENGPDPLRLIFGIVGLALFLLFVRGAWMMTTGPSIYHFGADEQEFVWGIAGKEQRLAAAEIRRIYWNDGDGFTFSFQKKDGTHVTVWMMDSIVLPRSRPELLQFLREVHPDIGIAGT